MYSSIKLISQSHRKYLSEFLRKYHRPRYNDKRKNKGPSNEIQLEILGTGAPGSPAAAMLMMSDRDGRYLFNCGEGVQRLFYIPEIYIRNVRHIFVTRLNWDRIGGIPGVCLSLSHIRGNSKKVILHGPPKLDKFVEYINSKLNFSNLQFEVRTTDKISSYENHSFRMSYVPIHRSKNNLIDEDPTTVFACQIKPVDTIINFEKCIEMNIKNPKHLIDLKNGIDVTLEDGTVCKAADIRCADEPQRSFLAVDIPSIDYLDALNHNEMLKKFQGSGMKQESTDVILHYSPAHIMSTDGYKEFMEKFPDSTTHLLLNERNRSSGLNSVSEIQNKHHVLNSHIFPLLKGSMKTNTESGNIAPQAVDRNGVYGGLINALPSMSFIFRPEYGIHFNDNIQKTQEECFDELKKIKGFEGSLKKLHERQASYYSRIDMSKRSTDFPKIVFLGTGSALPSAHRNVSSILVHTGKTSSILLDCGEGTCDQIENFYGSEADDIFRRIKGVFISHSHDDHYLGKR